MQHRPRKSNNDNENIGTVDKTERYWIPGRHLILVSRQEGLSTYFSMNMIIFCALHQHKNKQ